MKKRIYALLGVLLVATTLSGCTGGVVGDDNTIVQCVGNCPDLKVIPSSDDSGEVEYSPVGGKRVGSDPSAVRIIGGASTTKRGVVKKTPVYSGWYPWNIRRVIISRSALSSAFAADDREVLRVPTATFVKEVAALGIPSPQDPKKFAEWIRNSDRIKEVDCTADILKRHYMSRTNHDGSVVDMKWHRSSCYAGEKLLVFVHDDKREQPFLSLGCGNILTPIPKMKEKVSVSPNYPLHLAATFGYSKGCPREEGGRVMEKARKVIGAKIALVTHCIVKSTGPATGVKWKHPNRRKYGVASRWKKLIRDGELVGFPTQTAYRFENLKVKKGGTLRFVSFPSNKVFEVTAPKDGIIEIPGDLVPSPNGRTVLAFPRNSITRNSVMKWKVKGVKVCYPSDGDDNYTRGPRNGRASELYRAVARPDRLKNYTVTFTVSCGREV